MYNWDIFYLKVDRVWIENNCAMYTSYYGKSLQLCVLRYKVLSFFKQIVKLYE